MRLPYIATAACFLPLLFWAKLSHTAEPPDRDGFLREHCTACHAGNDAEAGLDIEELLRSGELNRLDQVEVDFAPWIKIHDRVVAAEMPPPADSQVDEVTRRHFTSDLFTALVDADRQQIATNGRAVWRRMNRFEYENTVRQLLHAPWLQLAPILPEDGEMHRFNKIGEALDISHVNMSRYMQAADYALRQVLATSTEQPPGPTVRYYAREQKSFTGRVHYNPFNRSPERATFPLIDYTADVDVLRDPEHPFTVGASDPERREREAFGVVASSYEPIEIRFSSFVAPVAGRYKLRFKGYTFWVQGEEKRWWRPDREKTERGRRPEPVTIYSQAPPRQLRRLGEFDFQIEPSIQELDVWLLAGESIQPDAVRLFRSRPSNWHNPLAESDGMPGVAFNWLEVEGPLYDQWPTAGHQLLFADLPLQETSDIRDAPTSLRENRKDRRTIGQLATVVSTQPLEDARRLMRRFLGQAYLQPASEADVERFTGVVETALKSGLPFQESMLTGYVAVMCSPKFLCMEEPAGPLDDLSRAMRLSLFLTNTGPDEPLRDLARNQQLSSPGVLAAQAERLLNSAEASNFVSAFLDYWLDLRKINDTTADETPVSRLLPGRRWSMLHFSRPANFSMIRSDLPVRNLIDSDFTFVNERLGMHYGLEVEPGAVLRRIELPVDSPRGGLLTQASVLKVTANGTTTSPVTRGAWINERLLGVRIPPPPASVPAIEPDTRGATTIREQLALHRADESCNVCHRLIDPAGFALECFDVLGGYRAAYRSLPAESANNATASGETSAAVAKPFEPEPGYGHNGQPFQFFYGPSVDASGELPDGRKFNGIGEFKKLLLADERAIARNLVQRLMTYATGAAPRFSDRVEIEAILDRTADRGFPVRSLIREIAASDTFLNK
ncbi:MAG: DUF1588 domain-containing protein [Pirellulaceae bacterium]